jgi:hypothetical protein
LLRVSDTGINDELDVNRNRRGGSRLTSLDSSRRARLSPLAALAARDVRNICNSMIIDDYQTIGVKRRVIA